MRPENARRTVPARTPLHTRRPAQLTVQEHTVARSSSALLALLLLGGMLAVSLVRFPSDLAHWPFGPSERSGEDYATLVTSQSAPDNGMAVGVLIRKSPWFEQLDRVEVPEDLDLLREPIAYGDRMLSPFFVRAIDDMIAGKIVSTAYDPVMSSTTIAELDAREGNLRMGSTTLVPPAPDTHRVSFRLYTDPDRTRYLLVPTRGVR